MFKIYMYQNIIVVFVRFKWVVCIFYESGHLILIRNVFSLFFFWWYIERKHRALCMLYMPQFSPRFDRNRCETFIK